MWDSFKEGVKESVSTVWQLLQDAWEWLSTDAWGYVTDRLEWVQEHGWDWFTKEGGANWLIAIPGAYLGFMMTQSFVAFSAGGGVISSLLSIPLAITGGMVGAILATRGFHAVREHFVDVDEIGQNTRAQTPSNRAQEQEVARGRETGTPTTRQEIADAAALCELPDGMDAIMCVDANAFPPPAPRAPVSQQGLNR